MTIGHVGLAADGPADLEAVDVGEHDVDQHDVGGRLGELRQRLLAVLRLVDRPALVLEGQAHRRADALIVFDAQDPGAHERRW